MRPNAEQPGDVFMFTSRWKCHGEDGQGLVEYALIIMLVALVVLGALRLLGVKLSPVFSTVAGNL
jgi:pilus assembly protein Flp/PilA